MRLHHELPAASCYLLAVGADTHKVLDKSRAFLILTSSIFTKITVEEMVIFES